MSHRFAPVATAVTPAAFGCGNPPPVVRWKLDKSYLRDLAALGIPIVPTVWLDPGHSARLAPLMDAHAWASLCSSG